MSFKNRVFGQYTLLERIATGGMAEIFLAQTRGLGGFEKTLVVKRLHPHYSDDQQFVQMLIDEAKIAVQLQHANIVQIFDLGRIGDQYYIAMEHVDGRDLFRVLRELHHHQLQMPLEAACFMVAELCHGLHYAHTKRDRDNQLPLQVVHRDISPQNILVSWSGEVKLADFGIVKAQQRSTHTEVGIIKGKFYYMSPEQALGVDLDYRSDLFSTGIVLFEALTATPLYDDTENTTLMERVQTGAVRSPVEFREDVPPELERIVMKALARDRADRYQSALEMARDLSLFITSRGRTFTKVDLSDFLRTLFPDQKATNPNIQADITSGDTIAEAGRFPESNPLIRTHLTPEPKPPPVATPRSEITRDLREEAEYKRPVHLAPSGTPASLVPPPARASHTNSLERPSASSRPDRQLPPLIPITNMLEESLPADPNQTAPTPRSERTGMADPNAHTTQLPKDQIVDSLGRPLAPPPPSTRDANPRQPPQGNSPGEALSLLTLKQSKRAKLPQRAASVHSNYQLAVQRRDRRLQTALGLMAAAIVAVIVTIIWLLSHPVEVAPPRTATPPTLPDRASSSSAETLPETTSPTGTHSSDSQRMAEQSPLRDESATAQLRISTSPSTVGYRLYVDGELTPTENGLVTVESGRHAIRATLYPQGTVTRERTIEVDPGTILEVRL